MIHIEYRYRLILDVRVAESRATEKQKNSLISGQLYGFDWLDGWIID